MMLLRVAWLLIALMGAAAVLLTGRACDAARREAQREVIAANRLTAEVAEIDRLSRVSYAVPLRAPDPGLAARLGETLAAVGLPPTMLGNITPEPELVVMRSPSWNGPHASTVKRRRASLTLSPITLPQLGSFLVAWRTRDPDWIVATIDLAPDRRQQAPEPGSDAGLTVVMTLDAVYLDQKGDGP